MWAGAAAAAAGQFAAAGTFKKKVATSDVTLFTTLAYPRVLSCMRIHIGQGQCVGQMLRCAGSLLAHIRLSLPYVHPILEFDMKNGIE